MKVVLLSITLFITALSKAQESRLSESMWVTKNTDYVTFKKERAEVLDFYFIRSFSGDSLLTFHHNYDHVSSVRIGGRPVMKRSYAVPDSKFRVTYFGEDSILLTAVNPAAIYVATKINTPDARLDEKAFIRWNRSGRKPKSLRNMYYPVLDSSVMLYNHKSVCNMREVLHIQMSTWCYNMDRKYFNDYYIDSSGTFYMRHISQSYKNENDVRERYFHGSIDTIELNNLDSLFSCSSLLDSGTVNLKRGYASHATYIDLVITHSNGEVMLSSMKSNLNKMQRSMYNAILEYTSNKDYEVTKSDFIHNRSRFNNEAD